MRAAALLLISSLSILGDRKTVKLFVEPVHFRTTFHFELRAPFGRAVRLFGPESEKSWAGKDWQPQFLYPKPTRDTEGAVFTLQREGHKSIWVNTIYDLQAGRMQYVTVIPEIVATVIDVRLTSESSSRTAVEVTYTRTALDCEANGQVHALAQNDAVSGPEWQTAIERSLK